MKHLKTIFACLLMAVLSIGQVWADPAAVGTTLFSENFGGYSADDVPSGSVSSSTGNRVIYGGGSVTYTSEDNGTNKTKIYSANLAGGTSPELLVGKSGGVFTITGIPSGDAQEITVSFKQNAQKLTISLDGTGYSTEYASPKPAAAGTVSFDITVADGADATFTLIMSAGSSNVRVDDILVTVKTAGEGAGPAKTLTSIAVSGTPTKTVYNTGDNFDPTGLTVTGTYSDASTAPISSGITWAYTPSQTLALNQTSIGVTATVSEITSAEYNVTGLTVSDPVVSSWQVIAPADLVTGDMVVLTMLKNAVYYAAPNNGGNSAPTATAVTVVGDKLSNEPAATLQWEVTVVSAGVYQFSVGENYLKCTDTNNGVKVGTGDYNTFDVVEENEKFYLHTTETMSSAASGRYLGIYNTQDWRCYGSVNNNIKDGSLVIFKDASAAATVAKPTISGDENFVTSTTVTLACSTTGAEIYYTTDGSDPKTSGSIGTSFSLTETKTVRAIAKLGSDWSAEATPKTFTKVTPMTTAAELRSFATSSAQNAFIQLDGWKVTFVNGNNAYMIDPSNEGVILNNASHGYVAGDELNDEVVEASVKLASGRVQLSGFTSTDITATAGTVSPTEITDYSTLTSAHQSRLVTLKDATYSSSDGTFSDGANVIYYYDQFSASPTLVDAATYDVTGVVIYYKNNTTDKVQVAPRTDADVEAKGAVVIPTAANLAALKAADRGTYILTLTNAVISYVNGNNAFIEDATGGALIYIESHGYSAGDCLNGDYQVTTITYQGKFEITAIEPQAGAATTTAEIPLTTVSIATLNASFSSYESRRVKIVGANVTDAISGSDRNGTINDGAELAVYAAVASTITLTADDNVDIIGYPGFHNTDQQLNVWRQEDITVNVKEDPELSYSPASVNLTVGDALSAPTFNNPHTLSPITYNTDNDAVATVDEYGAITLVGATGTAVITASYAGDATYNVGNATFTINVYDPAAAPKNVVIIAEYNTKFYAMSTALNTTSNYCPAIEVEKDGGNIVVTSAEDKAAIQWSMAVDEGVSPKTASFQAGVDEYLKGTSGGAGLSFATTPFDWEWDDTNNCYIVSGSTRGFFYKNDGIFKNYALSNLSNAAYAGVEIIEIDPENIVITSKVSAELAYDPESDEITQGDAWSAPSLVNPHSVTITSYNSDNEAVATVTDGGEIALAGGIGTAVITAHFDGDASYLEGDAVYTITVNAPAPTPSGTTYTKVTSTSDITDGEYLIVYEDENVAFNGNLTTLDAAHNTVSVVISEGVIAGSTEIDNAVFTIDVANGTLRAHMGDYIGVTSYGNGLKQNANAETYPAHSFSIDGDGNAVISLNDSWTAAMILNYNKATSDKRFRYYKSASPQQSIQLYKKETAPEPPTPAYTDVRTGLTSGKYYTICYNQTMTAIRGASLWEFAGKDASFAYIQPASAPFVAGTPYIIYAESEKLEAVVEEVASPVAGNHNGLYGTFTQLEQSDFDNIATNTGKDVYFIYNTDGEDSELRKVNGQTDNWIRAYRAYVIVADIPSAPAHMPAHVRKMPMQGQTTTGCELINAAEAPAKMMINGQLFILRGEKKYDATGRLVK